MCEHPRLSWVGTADGIHCGVCGAVITFGKAEQEKPAPEPEPEEKKAPAKKAPVKKGAKK